MVAKVIKSSVNVKSGNLTPMQFAAKNDMKQGDRLTYSTVYGIATGKSKNTDPKDPEKVYYGLTGTFEVQPATSGMDAVGSGRAFVPDAILNAVCDQLDKGAKAVSFLFEAIVVMGGTAGFTWEYHFAPDGQPEEEDTLAELRKIMHAKKVAELPAPTKGKVKDKEAA